MKKKIMITLTMMLFTPALAWTDPPTPLPEVGSKEYERREWQEAEEKRNKRLDEFLDRSERAERNK